MALGADLTAHPPPVRIPKLKFRNPLPADEIAKLPIHPQPIDSPRLLGAAIDPPVSPSSKAPSYDSTPSFDTASLTSSSLASTHSSTPSHESGSSKKTKKKASSVFGFLSLKEPSQNALEQFAEAQRKQDAEKSSPTPAARPGSIYPSQKLPTYVPKVNSKWNGLPETIKHRHSTSSGSSASSRSTKKRFSLLSQESKSSRVTTMTKDTSRLSILTDGTRNPPNSVASPRPSVSDSSTSDGLEPGPEPEPIVELPSHNTVAQVSYYVPEPLISGALPASSNQVELYPPTGHPSPPLSPNFAFETRDLSEQPDYPRPDSPASSTDSVDTVVRDTADVILKKLNDQPHRGPWEDAPAVQPPEDSEVAAVPESHDFLFYEQPLPEISTADSAIPSPATPPTVSHYSPARPVQNFSRPISSHGVTTPTRSPVTTSYRTTPISSGLPTLYEASLASTDHEESDAQSIAPSTIAPSELSEHWFDSPRERLGLGGRLRMNDTLPWEGQRESPGKKKSRLSMFGRVTTRA